MCKNYTSGYSIFHCLHAAIILDDCDVFGYTIWSMMDNFEWAGGYETRFGIIQVNSTDPNHTRVLKDSYYWYKQLIKDNGFDYGTLSSIF